MGEYKDSLNLPQTEMPMRAGLSEREPELLEYWKSVNIYKKLLQKNLGRQEFILHDGPPYPNGNIHVGHALNKILKDIVVKYKAMKGYYAPYTPGWDCHGLPIETQLLKEIKEKKEELPSASEFRDRCKQYSLHYVDTQREQFKRLGVFGDWSKPYLTLNEDYENNVNQLFDKLYAKGYVVKGRKPIHWCYNCRTALAEAELEYGDVRSSSVFVDFQVLESRYISGLLEKLSKPKNSKVHLVVWTTTPWTLPANVAVALHPDFSYALIFAGEEYWIVVEELAQKVMAKVDFAESTILQIIKGSELKGSKCQHPFYDRSVPVVCAEYVTAEDGTGCVHIAPGHGQEDYIVGKEYDLPIIMPVDEKGVLTAEAGIFAGMHVQKASENIVEHMSESGKLLKKELISHSYPHCWRCHNPVIFRATEQWFISVDHNDLRKRALRAIDETKWFPEWGIKRIRGMVEGRPDWCISRQRLWGLRIPIEGETDIMDVWLESGASWATLLGTRQADLYLEGSDQHRGWFQSSLLLSVAINDQAPYKAVLTHGFTVDEKGRKMSKSMGNVVDPLKVIEQYGADILRLWVVSTQFKDDMSISDGILKQVSDSYRKIRNTWRFLLSNLYDYAELSEQSFTKIDEWILLRLQRLTEVVESAYEEYEYHKIYHVIHNFCANDLSALYQDMVKDRLYCDATNSLERRSSQSAIKIVLVTLLKLMAPILSFTAEEVWAYLQRLADQSSKSEAGSIMLEDFPLVNYSFVSLELEKQWEEVFDIRSKVYQKIEEIRQNKTIAGSLDVKVKLVLPKNYGLTAADWELILIVSKVDLVIGGEFAVAVGHADGDKCERCWKWGELSSGLCSRCQQVVKV